MGIAGNKKPAEAGYRAPPIVMRAASHNDRMGRGTIRLASQGMQQKWLMRREKMSGAYAPDWRSWLGWNNKPAAAGLVEKDSEKG